MTLFNLSMLPSSLPSVKTAPWRGPLSTERKIDDQLALPKEIIYSQEPAWIYITIRRSGRKLLNMRSLPTRQAHTIILSSTNKDSAALRDFLWDEFSFMMSDVEGKRHTLKTPNYNKGELKMSAPIPWLLWITSAGKQGQTRNKDNFFKIWEENVESCVRSGSGSCQVTSILLPSNASLASIHSGALVASFDGGEEEGKAEITPLRPRCDSGVGFGDTSPGLKSKWLTRALSTSSTAGQPKAQW